MAGRPLFRGSSSNASQSRHVKIPVAHHRQTGLPASAKMSKQKPWKWAADSESGVPSHGSDLSCCGIDWIFFGPSTLTFTPPPLPRSQAKRPCANPAAGMAPISIQTECGKETPIRVVTKGPGRRDLSDAGHQQMVAVNFRIVSQWDEGRWAMHSQAIGDSVAFRSRPAALRRKYCSPPAGWRARDRNRGRPLPPQPGPHDGLRFHSAAFRIQTVL